MSTPIGCSEYPLNITGYDAIHTDGAREKQNLLDRSKDLFDDTSASTLEVLESGKPGTELSVKELTDKDSLKEHLETKRTAKTRFYSIYQEYSWGKMLVSMEIFLWLLSYIQVFPSFLEVVRSFGERVGPKDEGYSAFSDSTSQNTSDESGSDTSYTYESCYILKYAEQHGRPGLKCPWSIRQMGVYHKFDITPQTNTWIFLQPRTSFIDRLEKLGSPERSFSTHLLLLSSSMEGWREYIDWLEDIYTELNNIAICSRVVSTPEAPTADFKLDFTCMQRAQDLKKKLLHLSYIMGLNTEAIEHMRSGAEKLVHEAHIESSPLKEELSKYRESLSSFLSTLRSHKRRTQNLLQYMDGTHSLLQNILDVRREETVLRLSEIAGEQNKLMFGLSKKSTWDARSMRTITIVALAYLPPTFVSGFFGMNIFQQDSSLTMSQYLWIYAVVTIPLMVATFGIWYMWERRKRRGDEETADQSTCSQQEKI